MVATSMSAAAASGAAGGAAPPRTAPPVPVTSQTLPPSLGTGNGSGARLPQPALPPKWGPAPDERGLVFTPSGTGFLASGPYGYPAGVVTAPAEIERTTDQGKTWATVWRGRGYRVTWVGTAGDRVVATALTNGGQRPVLVEGTSSGASWQVVRASVSRRALPGVVGPGQVASAIASLWGSYQFHFLSPRVGFAVPDSMAGQAEPLPGVLLRTTDGGRHWAPVSLPGGTPTGGLAFTGADRGFATGAVNSSLRSLRCPSGEIWATSDGGSSWHAVPGTCSSYELTTLDFPDAKTGFAGGGQYLKYSAHGQELVMLHTADGGRHWSRVYRASVPGAVALDGNPFGEVAFFGPRDGLALDGGQTSGGNGPTGGHLWRTTDGGRHWRELDVTGLRLVLDGTRGAWLVGGRAGTGGDVLWRSLDRGLSWVPVGDPGYVKVGALAGYGSRLWVSTEAGDFSSYDGGRLWVLPPPTLRDVVASTWPATPVGLGADGTVLVGPGWAGDDSYWLSSDGGRTGKLAKLPALATTGVAAIAFDSPAQGIAVGDGSCSQPATVLTTDDGGASWKARAPLEVTVTGVSMSPFLAVVTGWGCDGNVIAISTDLGKTWHEQSTRNPCGSASVYARTVAMSCANIMSGGQYIVLSRDGGRRWLAAGSHSPSAGYYSVGSIVLTGTSSLLASGPPGVFLESSDGGAHWAVRRLLLPLVP